MMIKRRIVTQMQSRLDDRKALIVLGPRQSGKTTLVRQLVEDSGQKFLWLSGDETDVRTMLDMPTSRLLKNIIGSHKILVIDEAQRIKNIGICLKLITDNIPGVKVIATGSSALELADQINEPLTGRKWEFMLMPFSFAEMAEHHGIINEKRLLTQRLVYGYYPEVVNHPGDEKERLKQLADSYLYRDILTWENLHKPDKLEKLVQALAFQVGSLVSYHELGQICGLNHETVEKYIRLLEKAFIVYRINSLSRNLRNELKKSRKIYFFDNGLRNALISQFNPLELRNDKGALWENFLVTERMKHLAYTGLHRNRFFWRTHAQQEIDYIEEHGGKLHAFEFKWKKTRHTFPAAFDQAYKRSEYELVHNDNFERFVGAEQARLRD